MLAAWIPVVTKTVEVLECWLFPKVEHKESSVLMWNLERGTKVSALNELPDFYWAGEHCGRVKFSLEVQGRCLDS